MNSDHLDSEILEIRRRTNILPHITPSNALDEKKRFFRNRGSHNPSFMYSPVESLEITRLLDRIIQLEVPSDSPLKKECEQFLSQALRNVELIMSRGNGNLVLQSSLETDGGISPELVESAKSTLKDTPITQERAKIPGQKVKSELEKALRDLELHGWNVEFSEKPETTVFGERKLITLSKSRLFTESELRALPVHEVGVHALRAHNGYSQPSILFAIGLEGYLETEEGLASYFEKITNRSNPLVTRKYALRVLTIESMSRGNDFKTTFSMLKDYGLNDSDAWGMTLRAYRGGDGTFYGLAKDHVYFKGLRRVEAFHENGGNLDDLLVGKIGIDNLARCKKLIENGDLHKPSISSEEVIGYFK